MDTKELGQLENDEIRQIFLAASAGKTNIVKEALAANKISPDAIDSKVRFHDFFLLCSLHCF